MPHNPAFDEFATYGNSAHTAINGDPVAAAVAAAPPGNRHILTFYADGVVGRGSAVTEPDITPADLEKEN